jgi:hypothetical protein
MIRFRGLGATLPPTNFMDPARLAKTATLNPATMAAAQDAVNLATAQNAAGETDVANAAPPPEVPPECECLMNVALAAVPEPTPPGVPMALLTRCAVDPLGWMALDACRPILQQRRVWLGAGILAAVGFGAWWWWRR